jgi:hypothetical protein
MPLTILVLENPCTENTFDAISVLPFVEGLTAYSPSSILFHRVH